MADNLQHFAAVSHRLDKSLFRVYLFFLKMDLSLQMAEDAHYFSDISHGLYQISGKRVLLIHGTYLHIHRLQVWSSEMWTDLFVLCSSPESKLAQDTDHFAVVSHGLCQILTEIHFLHKYSSIF